MSGANSSATGGFLTQQVTPRTDDSLVDSLTAVIVGCTGIAGNLVRPRWQLNPPRAPEVSVDWMAVGITNRTPLDYPSIKHQPGGPDILTRWATYTVQVSSYGPDAQSNAESLRDALYVPQNLEVLGASGIKLLDAGEVVNAPELVNNQWYNRADMNVRFAVEVSRTYNVLDIRESPGTLTTQHGVQAGWDVVAPNE